MSVDWSFHLLVSPRTLTVARLASLFDAAVDLGFQPSRLASGEITIMSGDGTGSLLFSTPRTAVEWLGVEDGLADLNFRDVGTHVDLSVHRCTGILPIEMEGLPDEPHFDICTLRISGSDLTRPHREDLWAALEELLARAVERLGVMFMYGMDDDSLETQIPFLCIHKRVLADRLPPALGWLVAAPPDGGISRDIRVLAATLDRPVTSIGGVTALKVTDVPWDATPRLIGSAAETWRSISDRED
ncbi:MAG: hypothetical protein ACRDZ7_03855 [Acidimicrobiia bacterium]